MVAPCTLALLGEGDWVPAASTMLPEEPDLD